MQLNKPKFWDKEKISIFAIILYPLSLIYSLFLTLKSKLIKQKSFKVPIVCVGNVYLGGTGKTPIAIEIFKLFKSMNKNPAFVKKKYPYLEDEKNLLEKFGKVFFCKNRVESINELIDQDYDIAILDDGFQDFSIKKNLSILCFNSKQKIGNGYLLPSGPLREKLSSVNRASCILINGEKDTSFEDMILKFNPSSQIFYFKYQLVMKENLNKKRIVAFAGIGNPDNFFDLLKSNNLELLKTFSFPDHYNYTLNDLEKLKQFAVAENAILLTTEKDYCRVKEKTNINYANLKIKFENLDKFTKFINSKI